MSNLKYNYLLKQIVNPAALRKRLIELNAKYSKNRVHPVIDSWYLPTYQMNLTDDDDTATIQMCGMQFGHNGVWVAPVTKGHMIQQYSKICQHILDGTCTELDLGRLASIKGWISNSTEWDLLSDMQLDFLIEYLVQDLHGDY